MTHYVLIETPRLILRTVTMDDVEAVARRWKLDDGPISHQAAENQVRWMLANHRQNAPERLVHLCLAIIDKETQTFIGWCGLDHRDRSQAHPVLFYLLAARHRGRGLATEAAQALIDYAFAELGQARINGKTKAENVASKRVMEKIGMRYLGRDGKDAHCFTLGREERLRGADPAQET
jgi:[ribosomal protein S5]-alanine N-acetyltransferase